MAGWVGLCLLFACVAGMLWLYGASFYLLEPHARVDHPAYRMLSPGAPVGQGYGVVATALTLANLSYLVRRRLARWRLGSMRVWLNFHVATGVLAGLFALSHSALQMRNPLARVTMIALGIVIVTGIIGRFIYWFVPRADEARLRENLEAFEVIVPGVGHWVWERLQASPLPRLSGHVSLPKVLWSMPSWWRMARARKALVHSALDGCAALDPHELRLLRARIAETAALAAGVSRARAYEYLMRSWRGFHRFFALLMIVLMLVHAGVAWYYGYRWIFSDPASGA
jgi:hypothetical protein